VINRPGQERTGVDRRKTNRRDPLLKSLEKPESGRKNGAQGTRAVRNREEKVCVRGQKSASAEPRRDGFERGREALGVERHGKMQGRGDPPRQAPNRKRGPQYSYFLRAEEKIAKNRESSQVPCWS